MMFLWLWIAGILLAGIAVTFRLSKTRRPGLSALRVSLSGIALMMLINIFGPFTGVTLPVNYVTVSCSVILGAPGAVMMLFVRLLS